MRIRRLAPLIVAALLLAPLSACAVGSSSGSSSAPEIGAVPMTDDGFVGEMDMSAQPSAEGRSVIQTGDLTLNVDDPVAASEEVAAIVDDLGGFIESESLSNRDGDRAGSAYLLLRVPAERLDQAFDRVSEVGDLISQNRSSTDVTMQHVDLQARVEALEASVARLTELMAGSATTSELIEAEAALSQRQQELDGLRAQLESLEDQVEQASISVSLTTTSTLPGGPDNFWDGLVAGWDSLVAAGAGALVVLGILLPWLAIAAVIALVIVLIVRARRRAKRGESTPTPVPPATPPAAQPQAPQPQGPSDPPAS